MAVFLGLGCTECILLAVMDYDWYVANGKPLRYPTIMNRGLYVHMAAWSWITVQTVLTMVLPFCGNNVIDHLTCELLALLKLVCSDVSINVLIITVASIVFLVTSLWIAIDILSF